MNLRHQIKANGGFTAAHASTTTSHARRKMMRKLFTSTTMMLLLFTGSQAYAGIPVIDAANLANSIQQVRAWSQQFTQMSDSINQLRAQHTQLQNTYHSMTGNRGLGTLLNSPTDQAARRYLPTIGTEINNLARGTVPAYSALQSQVASLRSTLSTMPVDSLPAGSDAWAALNANLDALATQKALGQSAYSSVAGRITDTENLIAAIGGATDPKAIAEVQARISAQQVLQENENSKLQALAYMQRVAEQEAAQRSNEAVAKWGKSTLPSITF